jgi:LCP family protein required for cell wall assembly
VDVSPDVVWILAVGSDARPGEDMTRVRGDALQLIGMNTKTGAAASIGIPRDSYVSIPGVGSDRINAALYYGGPELLGETVGELIGIVPDYVFVTRFEKFKNMVNDIGGIEVDNPIYFSDTYLKPEGFEAGKQHLNGYLALAFSRIRHNLLRGDFDRSANQQRVLTGIQAKIRERASVHGFIEQGVLSAMENMATNASPAELYRLARAAAAVKPSLITTCVVLGGIGNIGGASVVLPYVDMAQRFGDRAREDATLESCD